VVGAAESDPEQKFAVQIPLLDPFPHKRIHAHLPVSRKWSWLGRVDEPFTVFPDVPDYSGAGPSFVPRNIDVMLDTITA
jgi:hypothetical protein